MNFIFENWPSINSYDRYDHKQFLANLKLNKDKFKTVTQDPEEYKKLLKSISWKQ